MMIIQATNPLHSHHMKKASRILTCLTIHVILQHPQQSCKRWSKVIDVLAKHVQIQDTWIDRLMDKIDGLMEGESSHAPGKGLEAQRLKKRVVRIPSNQKLVKHPKKKKVESNHYQKPRRLVALEEFLSSWFITMTARDSVEASYFNTDEEELKNETINKEILGGFFVLTFKVRMTKIEREEVEKYLVLCYPMVTRDSSIGAKIMESMIPIYSKEHG
ncbi:hypothetical protein RND71_019189 [Anisodus tanguticus]|uniref:Uncharacterized protein n=1 Tax=Anisodus tanguticus TaxID=243964 RepID=A0AAE1RYZ8_9SOLA|nr:hypothetical protein RND71_019189 [Anisodus tanguticus]